MPKAMTAQTKRSISGASITGEEFKASNLTTGFLIMLQRAGLISCSRGLVVISNRNFCQRCRFDA
jgi:hypothetical protein